MDKGTGDNGEMHGRNKARAKEGNDRVKGDVSGPPRFRRANGESEGGLNLLRREKC